MKRQSCCQHSADQSNGEPCRFGRKSGGTGGSGINLYHDNPVADRVMGKLYIGAADHLNGFHDTVCLFLKSLLQFFRNREHGRRTEGITRVHPQWINILDKADRNHIAVRIPHYFQFQLFPAQNGFLYQDLPYQTGLQTSGADRTQFFLIIYQSASCASHGISGAQHHGIPQPVRNFQRFFHTVRHFAAGHLNPQFIHGFLKFDSILAALNGIHLHTDNLHIIFVQNTRIGKLRTQIQT